ncbi:MAG: oxygen-independent coproporphyrinogen III oxidase [Paracoccaceae bacterium]
MPRYTSYPPANLFEQDTGRRVQAGWLDEVRPGERLSLYIHIPFCRRLCWFCACRTQGTRTLRPVESYVDTLIDEMAVVRAAMPERVSVSRLHLGGGTPTLLSPELMERLIGRLNDRFEFDADMEFSVEIDPTEAAPGVLESLAGLGMNRASIGVQDFEPQVQKAIGRQQSFEETADVVAQLRDMGVHSLNLDLLYGLPHQTADTLAATLEQVFRLQPDRLALYGYAHVPKMSKRQVMIDDSTLPGPRTRHSMAELAHSAFTHRGYVPLGIDHFAKPEDSLARAAANRTMRRNFQGYTDDPCETLIGLGASAISRFRGGFVQNAVATAAYADRVARDGLAGHRGLKLGPVENLIGEMISKLMCYGEINLASLPDAPGLDAYDVLSRVHHRFADVSSFDGARFILSPDAKSLTRVVAAALDASDRQEQRHSAAI